MPGLALFVLGSPQLRRNRLPVAVERQRALALLVYLAVTGEHHRRDALAGLFWPEYDHTRARAALRRTLATLTRALDGEALDADRETIGVRGTADGSGLWLDLVQFRQLLATCLPHGHPETAVCAACLQPLAEAVVLYRGDFLSGFALRDSPDFDAWQIFQTESLRRELAGALERLARGFADRKELERAIGYTRRWLALDPFHEPAHCYLMALYAWSGQRQAALRQYAECARILARYWVWRRRKPRPACTRRSKPIPLPRCRYNCTRLPGTRTNPLCESRRQRPGGPHRELQTGPLPGSPALRVASWSRGSASWRRCAPSGAEPLPARRRCCW